MPNRLPRELFGYLEFRSHFAPLQTSHTGADKASVIKFVNNGRKFLLLRD